MAGLIAGQAFIRAGSCPFHRSVSVTGRLLILVVAAGGRFREPPERGEPGVQAATMSRGSATWPR